MQRSPLPATDDVPDLAVGLNLVTPPARRTSVVHRLVLAELRKRAGPAFWIDARNTASTYVLHDLAPSPRTLDPLRIARAFTAYQHHALVRSLPRHVTDRTAFIVAPRVADLYRDDDIPPPEDRTYLAAVLSILDELGTSLGIPVLVSAIGDDPLTAAVAEAAGRTIAVEATPVGYRFVADDFETTIYWQDGYWQTTIPYWVELFGVVDATEPSLVEAPDPLDVAL